MTGVIIVSEGARKYDSNSPNFEWKIRVVEKYEGESMTTSVWEIENINKLSFIYEGLIVQFEPHANYKATVLLDDNLNPVLIDWQEEMKKCQASPYYFATKYMKVNGEPFGTHLTEEAFNEMFNIMATKNYKSRR